MTDWTPRTDLDPDHYAFRRQLPDRWYADRYTYADKVGDRIIVVLAVLVIALVAFGALQ